MSIEISYRDLLNHESMLQDEVRCKAFRDALFEVVTPDSVVLDIGAGTGILSIFAAQAGAKKVYAVERSPVAQCARQIVADNGLSDRVEVFQGEMEGMMVRGEQNYLSNPDNAGKIRVLLLAGIRAAVLWHQLGGSKWKLMIFRKKYVRSANQILMRI